MQRVISLLIEKNRFLRKFYTLNKAELFRLQDQDFSRLEYFHQARETLLEMIDITDKKIEDLVAKTSPDKISQSDRTKVQEELEIKDHLVTEILDFDLKILALIESAKNNLIRELTDVTKNKQATQAYGLSSPTKTLKLAK